MNRLKTEIIVLNEQKYSESSKIIKVLSREYGKLSILAKGALNAKSKLISITSLFSLSEVELIKGKNFYYINEFKLIESFYGLRENYIKLIYGNFLLELINKTTIETHIDTKIFNLVKKTLYKLNETKYTLALILAFELKYMSFIGYRPLLSEEKDAIFSIEEGGLVKEENLKGYPISQKNIYYLNELLYTSLDNISQDISDKDINYLQMIILKYIKYNLDIEKFNSLNLL